MCIYTCVGLAKTIYIRCIYGVYIRSWPTLYMCVFVCAWACACLPKLYVPLRMPMTGMSTAMMRQRSTHKPQQLLLIKTGCEVCVSLMATHVVPSNMNLNTICRTTYTCTHTSIIGCTHAHTHAHTHTHTHAHTHTHTSSTSYSLGA